jgi:hypothetical protein
MPGCIRLITLAVTAVTAAALATGCSPDHHSASPATATSAAVARRVQHLRSVLPAGFQAPGGSFPAGSARQLSVAQAPPAITPAQFHVAPAPTGGTLKAVVATIVNQPVPIRVGALFVTNSNPKPGGTVTVVATHLGANPGHDALFILSGPDQYRAERLVQVRNDIAAGVVTLPSPMGTGPWYLVVQDLSEVTSAGPDTVTGTALVDVAQLTPGH